MPSLSDSASPIILEPPIETQQIGENVSGGILVVSLASLGTSEDVPVRDSGWRMFLRWGDRDVALGHNNFL